MIEAKYLIISMENQCVFTIARDPVTANALSASNINTLVRVITRYSFDDNFDKLDRKFFQNEIYKLEVKDRHLTSVDPTTISQEWQNERTAMQLRQDGHGLLEIHYLTAISVVERSHSAVFPNEAWQEIILCNPENNTYTQSIEEYARIVDKDIVEVYKELKLRLESERVVRFRILALVEKWKIKINRIQTKTDLKTAMDEMHSEFWWKSQI